MGGIYMYLFVFEAEESLCMALAKGYTVWTMDRSKVGTRETKRWDEKDFFLLSALSLYHSGQGRILWPIAFISPIACVFMTHQGNREITTIRYHGSFWIFTLLPRLRFL